MGRGGRKERRAERMERGRKLSGLQPCLSIDRCGPSGSLLVLHGRYLLGDPQDERHLVICFFLAQDTGVMLGAGPAVL